jgi:acyl transferase domain-containing protein
MNAGDIAIVGIACRFPGARDAGEFWRNLCEGRESSTELSEPELLAAGITPEELAQPSYVKKAFAVDGADEFDAHFFGVHPEEARLMDPQQRLLLEVGYEALEDAAQVTRAQRGTTSVFASAGGVASSYLLNLGARFAARPHGTGTLAHLVNDKDFLATRLSFKLGLTGPSLSIQTACSSSLVAVHLARMSLLVGESDLAVAGASCIRVPLRAGYVAAENAVLSPVGKCKAFADDADGTVFGSGVAAVVLKRYADALRDRDHVYALVKSTATTNDGAAKIGYTASSVPGQAKAMMQAITAAGVSSRDISYVECHGTATRIGDPLEIKALERVFRVDTADAQFCGIGSVKTNIGHLEQAAGLASLIKLALMLKHRKLVPSINFRRPNPKLGLEKSPFFVVREANDWSPGRAGSGLVAAINCLGIGGTNAFAVLAEAPAPQPSIERDLVGPELLCVSAKTPEQLQRSLERLADFVDAQPGVRLRDFCYTVNVSRSHHRVRFCGVISGERVSAELLRAASARLQPAERVLGKQTLYVCNPIRVVGADTVAAFEADPRLRAFRASYADLSARLYTLQPQTVGPGRERSRTLAFEAALHAQLVDWGIVAGEVVGRGFGRLVKAVIDAPDVDRVLPGILAQLEDEPLGGDPLASAPEAGSATHYTVQRCSVAREGAVLEDGSEPFSKDHLFQFLARHLELGRELDWESYYRDTPASGLSIPTYPFARDRYWLEA